MEMTLVLVTPPQIKDIVLSHSCCETSMDGSAKKRRLLKEVLLDICIKCTVWKAERPNNRKNRVYWVYVRKTAQKWNLCCCIRKNHIFPHLLRQDLKNPGWLIASGVHESQVPEYHCTSEPNIPDLREIADPLETAFPSKPTELQSDFAPCRRQFGPLRTKMLLAFEGWALPHDVPWRLHNAAPCSTQMAKYITQCW